MRPPVSNGVAVPPLLLSANLAFHAGNFAEAAAAYLKLAEKGVERGHHQAPNLYLQAARCYVMLGKSDEAVKTIREVAQYLAKEQRWADLYRALQRSQIFLQDREYRTESRMVESWKEELIPVAIIKNLDLEFQHKRVSHKKALLPTHCPSCGGSVNPLEVEWVDEGCVVCEFCGSIVRGE
jgi:tetratricopeptide (TPR) repeat protein